MGPLRMWETTLWNIIHYVKTAHGLTNDSYHFSATSPIHGPGQGSRGGPASCSTMTSLLIECMERLCYGYSLTDPQQRHHYATTVNMFIDDASNCTNDFLRWLHPPPTKETVVQMLRHDSQTWERSLWTSGGLLNLLKCLYYIIYWEFDSEGQAFSC